MFEIFDATQLASLFSLTILEIVLGIDNVIFIALLVGHLPKALAKKARFIGLGLALLMRIAMLFGIFWLLGLTEPMVSLFDFEFSGKDLIMLAGGLFLIYKSTDSIHEEMTHEEAKEAKSSKANFALTVAQIVAIDIIFSLDSVITAVGMTDHIGIIIVAMTIAMLVMLAASGKIADFITRNPTLKMLALSFIMMIGVFLIAEGLHFHVPKGYIYFAMGFSLGVEILNMLVRDRRRKK